MSDPYYGKEPNFNGLIMNDEEARKQLGRALNWYAANSSNSQIANWGREYFRNNFNAVDYNKFTNTSDLIFRKIGLLYRIKICGFSHKILEEYISREHTKAFGKFGDLQPKQKKSTSNVYQKIQDGLYEKAKKYFSELDIIIDDFIENKKTSINFSEYSENIPKEYKKFVINRLQKSINDISEETYNIEIPKYKSYLESLMGILKGEKKEEVVENKPRKTKKKKIKTPKELVKRLQLNANGNKLEKIIGSEQIYIYDDETRKLYFYKQQDNQGLSVSGRVISSFDEKQSFWKLIRKPDITLPEITKLSKIQLRKFVESLSTLPKFDLSGRVSGKMKLLRIF